MTTQWLPLADRIIPYPTLNKGYPGRVPHWRAVTWHISEGSLDSTLSWLTEPVSQASAHVVIGRAGEIYNLVPLDEASWNQGIVADPDLANPIVKQTVEARENPNLVSYGIECVGQSSWGHGGSLTRDQASTLVKVTAYLCLRSRLTVDATHILRHSQWDGRNRSGCPGFSDAEYREYVSRAHELALFWRGW